MNISQIMTTDVELTAPSAPILEAARRMRDEDVGALPVGEDDRLVGMVTDRDIAVRGVAEGKAPDDCVVRDVMSGGVYYCFDDEEVERAAEVMAEHKVRRLPIVNRDKRLVGVVSLADLARAGVGEEALRSVSEPTAAPRA
jgi:CBS domain-containing protein